MAGSAVAAGAATDRIYGCRSNKGGALRVVSRKTACKDGETRLFWNVRGDRGPRGYRGYRGEVGATGATGARGPQGVPGIAVAQHCASGSYVSGITSDGTLSCTPLPTGTGQPSEPTQPTEPTEQDSDLDGWPDTEDCAPEDSSIYPGATETANGLDDDCDGEFDEGFVQSLELALTYDAVRVSDAVPGTVTLTLPAPPGGIAVTVSSSDAAVAQPATEVVVVPEGATTGLLWVDTPSAGTATITATLGDLQQHAGLTVHPQGTLSEVESVSAPSPISVQGGAVSATVTLDLYVENSTTVSLSSSDEAVASVPASVTVADKQTTATFDVTPLAPGTTTITASVNGTQAQVAVDVSE